MAKVPLSQPRVVVMPRVRPTSPVPVVFSIGIEDQFYCELERHTTSFPPKLTDTASSVSTVDYAVSAFVLAPTRMDPAFKKKRKPEVDLRVYTKTVYVSNTSPFRCAKSRDLATRFPFPQDGFLPLP